MRSERQELTGIAYSYIRFSSKEQEKGDSVRRQTDMRDRWLKRHPGVTLDGSLTMDLGASAFRGGHRSDKHALGQFLRMVERGTVRPGSLFIIENLDRLTREDELEATHLFTGLLLAGVRVVQLEPETVFTRQSDQMDIMRAVLELSRGHRESLRKSLRVSEAWAQRKKRAAERGEVITRRCPAWLEVADGKYRFKPGAKALVQRVYAMAAGGSGGRAIAGTLNGEGVTNFVGRPWDEMYVRKVLTSRATVGEYQPMRGGRGAREADGPPVPNYFPAAVTEAEWYTVRNAMAARKNRGSRPLKEFPNPFATLLKDARDGGPINITSRVDDHGGLYRVLIPGGSKRGTSAVRFVSFPYDAFERAILSKLKEIDPAEILPADDGTASRVVELAGKAGEIGGRIDQLKARLRDGDLAALDVLREWEGEYRRVADELSVARAEAANPLAEAWGEARSLADVLETNDTRLRLRAALRRVVSSVWCLFVARGSTRLAAVQVWFAGDAEHRDYLIHHRPARGGTGADRLAARTHCRSFVAPAGPGKLDFRRRADAKAVEAWLAELAQAEAGAGNPAIEDRRDRVERMRADGMTVRAIAAELGLNRRTVTDDIAARRKLR